MRGTAAAAGKLTSSMRTMSFPHCVRWILFLSLMTALRMKAMEPLARQLVRMVSRASLAASAITYIQHSVEDRRPSHPVSTTSAARGIANEREGRSEIGTTGTWTEIAETFKMWGMSTMARGSNLLRIAIATWPNRWQAKRETAERLKRQSAELVREKPHGKRVLVCAMDAEAVMRGHGLAHLSLSWSRSPSLRLLSSSTKPGKRAAPPITIPSSRMIAWDARPTMRAMPPRECMTKDDSRGQ